MVPTAGKMLWHLLRMMVVAKKKKRGKSETTPFAS